MDVPVPVPAPASSSTTAAAASVSSPAKAIALARTTIITMKKVFYATFDHTAEIQLNVICCHNAHCAIIVWV